MNVPRHASRYSNLVSVDVPDVSFQKPLVSSKPGKKSKSSNKEESDQGPSLMELYPLTVRLMCVECLIMYRLYVCDVRMVLYVLCVYFS